MRQVRLVANQSYRAAHRTRSEERALGSAQNLDAIQVIQIGIDHHMTILGTGWSRQRNIIEIEPDRCGVAAARGHAAHLDLRLTWPFGLQGNTWCALCQRGQGGDAASQQSVAGDRRDADRRVLHRGDALLRGHDHFLELARIVGIRDREGTHIKRKDNRCAAQRCGQPNSRSLFHHSAPGVIPQKALAVIWRGTRTSYRLL